jgi:hypothetical protein
MRQPRWMRAPSHDFSPGPVIYGPAQNAGRMPIACPRTVMYKIGHSHAGLAT